MLQRARRLGGGLLILLGLALHPWAVWRAIFPAKEGVPGVAVLLILCVGVVLITFGVQVLRGRLWANLGRWSLVGVCIPLSAAIFANVLWLAVPTTESRLRAEARLMLDSENLIADLTPRLASLKRSAFNLIIPGEPGAALFDERITVVDLAHGVRPPSHVEVASIAVAGRDWSVEPGPRTFALSEVAMWRPVLAEIEYFDFAKFYFISGSLRGKRQDEFSSRIGFEGQGRTRAGLRMTVKATNTVIWRLRGTTGAKGAKEAKADWRIYDWRTLDLHTQEAAELPFVEVLDRALPDPAERDRARKNRHAEIVLEWLLKVIKDPSKQYSLPYPHFTVVSQDRHPGVSVVDIDRDGFDDLYVMPEIGRNMLLRNRGDGTFEEIAAKLGLDLEDHTASAVFADFDNDGDLDAFLGRTLARSAYLVNEGGRFVDRSSALVSKPLPYLVSSVTAADYDGDGLLDVYLSTYAEIMLGRDVSRQLQQPEEQGKALAAFIPEADAIELERLDRHESTLYINEFGPPNVLLHNLGDGRFAEAENAGKLKLFRNTYQSTWADYDGDGDPDLYCANDFAPNNLFKNDGGGKFTDVTRETGTQDNGFGMGASWGDYDGDGRQDLYVSNMFSKAGRRITAFMPEIDPRFAEFARGNTLFRNRIAQFDRVSGLEPPAVTVEKAGWSWGSQFVDVNNDGWLDIYAPNGHYTAPKQVEQPVDT